MRRALLTVAICFAALAFQSLVADYGTLRSVDAVAAPNPPAIVSREMWRAKPPVAEMKPQRVFGIILHHTATPKKPGVPIEEKMRGLQSFSQRPAAVTAKHVKPAWPDVPYHFYVDAIGRIAEGRDMNFAGDTNTNYDTAGYIQIAVEGDFEKESLDPAQLASLRGLLVWLVLSRQLGNNAISMHKDHAPTACPGRNFIALIPSLLAEVAMKTRR